MLGKANGVEFRNLKHKGMRRGCHCIGSRDIGAYDTCMNGCRYCYANRNPRKAFENHKLHDPESPRLLGTLNDGDTISDLLSIMSHITVSLRMELLLTQDA